MKKYSSLTKSVEIDDEDQLVTPAPIEATPTQPQKQISFKQQSSIFSVAQLPLANMTRSYTFSINDALEYTCHRQTENDRSYDFCGTCNSCQIIKYMNNMKQWFHRASDITLKKFLVGLIVRINNVKIYKYLNDLLKPMAQSKDYTYSRNKYLPSCEEDHLKIANNRCLDNDFINRQINFIWAWYSNSNHFIKQNFMISVLSKCEQALVFQIIVQIKTILESAQANMKDMVKEPSLDFDEFSVNIGTSTDTTEALMEVNYNSDIELVCEAYDEDDDEDPVVKADEEIKFILNQPNQGSAKSNKNSKYVDFLRQLPVHLSKKIMNSLDSRSHMNCFLVCKYWSAIAKEVKRESYMQKQIKEDLLILKGDVRVNPNPKYANNVDVQVPNLYPGTYECKRNTEKEISCQFKSDCNWENALAGYQTRNVIMEERNIFCGPYNIFVLKEKKDAQRVVHLNGKNTVGYASLNRRVDLIDIKNSSEKDSGITGHAGTIKAIYVCEKMGIIVTGSYDTSVRCWSIHDGKCLAIFQGHQQTVTCLDMYEPYERIISGCNDKTCKVWNYGKSKERCWRTFKHSYAVVAVAISEEFCVTGGQTGRIKLFHLMTGHLIKSLAAHQGRITSLVFDKWHIISAGVDGYALAFSTQGKHKKCLSAMRHPGQVNCVKFLYMRAITGCADGKVRIWNILNGNVLRSIRGNSRSDAILSMTIVDNRVVLNTENNILLLEFEKIKFEYDVEELIECKGFVDTSDNPKFREQRKTPTRRAYSAIRASRMALNSTPNSRLFNDNRKTIIDHSFRPVGGKCLTDARRIYSAGNKGARNEFSSKANSVGHISDYAMVKRRSVMESINAIISSQGTHSILSNYGNMHSAELVNDLKVGFHEVDDSDDYLAKVKRTPLNLTETKQYLREQLREIRQSGRITNPNRSDQTDTKSMGPITSNDQNQQTQNNGDIPEGSITSRPQSSPCRVNTKRIKMKAHHFKARLQAKTPVIYEEDSDEDPIFKKQTNISKTFISKKFESQELETKTNTAMYPVNVKCNIPKPKLIRPQTSPSKRVDQLPATCVGTFLANPSDDALQKMHKNANSIVRAKSAMAPQPATSTPPKLPQRPRTAAQSIKLDINMSAIDLQLSATTNSLNLKTFQAVDQMASVMNSYTAPPTDQGKEREKSEIYKKFWHLKSIGQYHGSLLAKPKIHAPEIRE